MLQQSGGLKDCVQAGEIQGEMGRLMQLQMNMCSMHHMSGKIGFIKPIQSFWVVFWATVAGTLLQQVWVPAASEADGKDWPRRHQARCWGACMQPHNGKLSMIGSWCQIDWILPCTLDLAEDAVLTQVHVAEMHQCPGESCCQQGAQQE